MCGYWSTLADMVAQVESVGETRGDAHALVKALADTLAEKEAGGEIGDMRAHWSTLWVTC